MANMIAPPLIAIVEDDDEIRTGLSSLLRAEGYRVEMFSSAETFLKSLQSEIPDCLVTDVQLSTTDGLDLQQSLLLPYPSLPVIVMTAYPQLRVRERAISQGAVCFLSKPFANNELLHCIVSALEGST